MRLKLRLTCRFSVGLSMNMWVATMRVRMTLHPVARMSQDRLIFNRRIPLLRMVVEAQQSWQVQ